MTYFRYDGHYFELLIICGVILLTASEIISALWSTRSASPPADFYSGEVLHELKEINNRLVNVQLAIQHLEPPRQWRS
jgi:hypothetical protein